MPVREGVTTVLATCSTKGPSHNATTPAPASIRAAAPTSPMATIGVIPMLTSVAAGNGTLDGEHKGAASPANIGKTTLKVVPSASVGFITTVPVTCLTSCLARQPSNTVPSVASALSVAAGARDDSTPSPTAPTRCSTYCSTADAMASSQPIQVCMPEALVATSLSGSPSSGVSALVCPLTPATQSLKPFIVVGLGALAPAKSWIGCSDISVTDITKRYVFVSHEAIEIGVSMLDNNIYDMGEDRRAPWPLPPLVLAYVLAELQHDMVQWQPWPPPLHMYLQSNPIVATATSQNSGVTGVLGTVNQEEHFTDLCVKLNVLENFLNKPCAEARVRCLHCCSSVLGWFSVDCGVPLICDSLLLAVFLGVLEMQSFAQEIYILGLEELGETTLTISVFMEDLLRRAMGNSVEFIQSNLAIWVSLVLNIWKRMEALQQLDERNIAFPIWATAVEGDYTFQLISGQVLWGLPETAYGLPLEVLPYCECPDLNLALASYEMVWQIAWSLISRSSSRNNMKMGGNKVLIIRFCRAMLLELLGPAHNLFSGGTCEAHKVQSSKKFTSSNQLQEGTCINVEHLNYPVVKRNIPDASHCGGEDHGLARTSHIWLVAWIVDGLEFSTGGGQEHFKRGTNVIRAVISDQVHVSCDCYIACANQISVDYEYYLDQAYYVHTVCSDIISYGEDYHATPARPRRFTCHGIPAS